MTDAATVRPTRPGDAAGIADVHVDAWRETYADVMPEEFFSDDVRERRRAMWTNYLAIDPEPGKLMVAERAGRIVGFAFAGSSQHPDAQKGHEPARDTTLFSIYVLASEHGHGLGHALLEAVLNYEPAQLWVLSTNAHAIRFYEQHGFSADGIEVVDPDINGLIDVRMVR